MQTGRLLLVVVWTLQSEAVLTSPMLVGTIAAYFSLLAIERAIAARPTKGFSSVAKVFKTLL